MGGWWRKLRGALGLSTVWGALWGGIELLQAGFFALMGAAFPVGLLPIMILNGFTRGFLSGLVFSAGFAWLNRNRSLNEIRGTSSILLGAAVGAIFSLVSIGVVIGFGLPAALIRTMMIGVVIGAGLGAGTSYGLLKIARSGEDALTPGPDSSGIGGGESPLISDGNDGLLES